MKGGTIVVSRQLEVALEVLSILKKIEDEKVREAERRREEYTPKEWMLVLDRSSNIYEFLAEAKEVIQRRIR